MTTPQLTSGSLEQRLKERIQGHIQDLLPEETVDRLMQEALTTFLEGRPEIKDYRGYVTQAAVSSEADRIATDVIKQTLSTEVQQRVTERMQAFVASADGQAALVGMADRTISSLTPAFLQGMVQGLMVPVVQQMMHMMPMAVQNAIMSGQIQLPPRNY